MITVGKEKLVYILNPDGLTESIFVAKGEVSEGQYRGKRFTKAGWKAEKKRLKEELTHQSLEQVGSNTPLNQLDAPEDVKQGDAKTWEEYSKHANTSAIPVVEEIVTTVPETNTGSELHTFSETASAIPDLILLMEELEGLEGEIPVGGTTTDANTSYAENNTVAATKIKQIYIVGSTKGQVFILDKETLNPIRFDDYPAGFISKQEIVNHLILLGAQYPKVNFTETDGGIFFTATAEYS